MVENKPNVMKKELQTRIQTGKEMMHLMALHKMVMQILEEGYKIKVNPEQLAMEMMIQETVLMEIGEEWMLGLETLHEHLVKVHLTKLSASTPDTGRLCTENSQAVFWMRTLSSEVTQEK